VDAPGGLVGHAAVEAGTEFSDGLMAQLRDRYDSDTCS